MKIKFFIFLFITLNVFSQSNDYLNIRSTKLFIKPPKGFVVSKNIIGLEKNENVAIQVMDLVGGNFTSNTSTYTKLEFEKRGITVLELLDLKVDGYNAKFSNIKGKDGNEGVQLVFGDDTFSIMIMAFYPSYLRDELFIDIKESLLNVKYNKTLVIDPFAENDFKVGENNSKFKFAKASANMFLFSENGIIKDSYENEPLVMITSFPLDETVTIDYVLESSINGLLNQGFIKKDIKNIKRLNINGYNAIEGEYYFEHNSKMKYMYMTVLGTKNKAVLFYGSAESDFKKNIVEFKKVIKQIIIN